MAPDMGECIQNVELSAGPSRGRTVQSASTPLSPSRSGRAHLAALAPCGPSGCLSEMVLEWGTARARRSGRGGRGAGVIRLKGGPVSGLFGHMGEVPCLNLVTRVEAND